MKDGQKKLAGYAYTFFVIGLLLMSSTECNIQTEAYYAHNTHY